MKTGHVNNMIDPMKNLQPMKVFFIPGSACASENLQGIEIHLHEKLVLSIAQASLDQQLCTVNYPTLNLLNPWKQTMQTMVILWKTFSDEGFFYR